jgi:hypothetical protein
MPHRVDGPIKRGKEDHGRRHRRECEGIHLVELGDTEVIHTMSVMLSIVLVTSGPIFRPGRSASTLEAGALRWRRTSCPLREGRRPNQVPIEINPIRVQSVEEDDRQDD